MSKKLASKPLALLLSLREEKRVVFETEALKTLLSKGYVSERSKWTPKGAPKMKEVTITKKGEDYLLGLTRELGI